MRAWTSAICRISHHWITESDLKLSPNFQVPPLLPSSELAQLHYWHHSRCCLLATLVLAGYYSVTAVSMPNVNMWNVRMPQENLCTQTRTINLTTTTLCCICSSKRMWAHNAGSTEVRQCSVCKEEEEQYAIVDHLLSQKRRAGAVCPSGLITVSVVTAHFHYW